MKNSILTIALVMSFASLFAQPCLPEGISFYYQSEIDSFQDNYPGCTEIEGNVKIMGSNITNLNGLLVLTAIGGNLKIEMTFYLSNLDGLNNLMIVGGNVYINQTSLENISGFQNLTSTGGDFKLTNNLNIVSLNGLSNLTSVGGTLAINSAPSISNLSGLENLLSVGEMYIAFNSSLRNIYSLSNIQSINGGVYINSNTKLESLTGLNNLASIGDHLIIMDNNSIKNMDGLNNLSEVGQQMFIRANDSLTNLNGLESLTSVAGILKIEFNPLLESIVGIDNLESIGDHLEISHNPILYDISALNNINPASVDEINIIGNDSLSECDVESICNYLSNPNNNVEIYDNAPGCNSPEEVIEACFVNTPDNEMKNNQCIISPNPFYETTIVTFNSGDGLAFTITLSNSSGQVLNESHFHTDRTGYQQFTLETSDLAKGIYFLTINDGNEIQTSKLIKL